MGPTLKELFVDMTDEEWRPILHSIAEEEYARAHRFMVPVDLQSVKARKKVKVHPKAAPKKQEQIELIIKTFESNYIDRLKSGFQLILDELGNMAGEEDLL